MNLTNIWPNGFEKTGPCSTCNHQIDRNVKDQAVTLLKEGKSIQVIADTLNLHYQTVAGWKSTELKERY